MSFFPLICCGYGTGVRSVLFHFLNRVYREQIQPDSVVSLVAVRVILLEDG